MTLIITRYFPDATQARKARREMIQIHRYSPRIIDVVTDAGKLSDALSPKGVSPSTINAYEQKLATGGAVMSVAAGYKPLRVAQITRDLADQYGATLLSGIEEEVRVKDVSRAGLSILPDHQHIMMVERDPESTNYHMANWPIPLLSRRAPGPNSLTAQNYHLTEFAFPLTDRRKPFTGSIFPPHARMANFPIGLISHRKPFTGSIFPRHARMANFPIRLISRRKPMTASIFPRHQRMATVPFPLLINGKTGQNALIPGGPRMANFPIRLISRRKPNTASIFPRHARMANFPIGLISHRKPNTASIFPRHARMADMFLPLVVRRSDVASKDGGSGFSFSKLLGMKTVSNRTNR